MGTGTNSTGIKKVKPARCSICREIPTPTCDWQQGRCPHRSSMIDSIMISHYKTRFFNLFKFLKGNK
jgi:hypothetical protein